MNKVLRFTLVNRLYDELKQSPRTILLLCSMCIALILYYQYIFGDRIFCFVDIGADTYEGLLPQISIKSLFLKEKSWYSFYPGLGDSVLRNVFLFDIFTLPSFFMDISQIMYSLVYIVILKHLLASIFFYQILLYYHFTNFARIVASLLFGYIGFILIWGQQYMFSSLVVVFCLTLWAFEIWLNKRKFIFFVLSFSYLTISCGFFSIVYSLHFSIFLLFYAAFRYIYLFDFKRIFSFTCKTFFLSMLAVLISSVIFLPVIQLLWDSPRISGTVFSFKLFFDLMPFGLDFFLASFIRFFSNDVLGVGSEYKAFMNFYEIGNLYSGLLSIMLLPILFIKSTKKEKYIIISIIILLYLFFNNKLFVLFFAAYSKGYEFRYGYLFSIVLLIGVAATITKLQTAYINKIYVGIGFFITLVAPFYALYYAYTHNIEWNISQKSLLKFALIHISFLSLYYYIFIQDINKRRYKLLIIGLVMIEIIVAGHATINDRSALLKNAAFQKMSLSYFDGTVQAIEHIKKLEGTTNNFYRISKTYNSVGLNDSLAQKYFGLDIYAHNNRSYIYLSQDIFGCYLGYKRSNVIKFRNDLPYLASLLSVKYILSKTKITDSDFLSFLTEIDGIYIYRNKKYVPFGSLFFSVMPEMDTPKNVYELEKLLYENVISDDNSLINKYIFSPKEQNDRVKVGYSVISNSNISNFSQEGIGNFNFNSTNNDPMMTIALEKRQAVSLRFQMYSPLSTTGQIYFADSNKNFTEDSVVIFNVNQGMHNYNININFPATKLRFDPVSIPGAIQISGLEMDLLEPLQDRKFESINILDFRGDYIAGTINASKNGVMLLPIPSEKGWKVFINGKETIIYRVNYGLMGIEIAEGNSYIEVQYSPPFMKLGSILSLLGICILIIMLILEKRKNQIITL